MKLRLENNTLRLRLSEAEVQTFAATGAIETAVRFGPQPAQQLVYALRRGSPTDGLEVQYNPNHILVLLPAAVADAWTSTDQNGLAETLPLPGNQQLKVLIEKDLDCRH